MINDLGNVQTALENYKGHVKISREIDFEAAKDHLRLLNPADEAAFVFQVFRDHPASTAFPANKRGRLMNIANG